MSPSREDRERIRRLLQIEGAAVFVLGVYLWTGLDHGWPLFIALFLAPDLTIVAYGLGPVWGARAYNAVHTYVAPLMLGGYAALSGARHELLLGVAYVWCAHIGLDRMIATGLKYPTAFKHTHLSPLAVLEADEP